MSFEQGHLTSYSDSPQVLKFFKVTGRGAYGPGHPTLDSVWALGFRTRVRTVFQFRARLIHGPDLH